MAGSENPATRLKTFMTAIRPHAGSGIAVVSACAEAFGLTWPDDYRLVMRRLADVADLAYEVRILGGDPEQDSMTMVMLADFGQVEQVMSQLPGAANLQMTQMLKHMTDAGWRSLDLAEALLTQRRHFEPVLDASTVQRLLEQVRSLIDESGSAEDPDEASRVALVQRLRTVEEALLNIKVTGTAGVEVAAEGLVGHVVNQPPEKRRNPVIRRVAEVASTALVAAAAATGAMLPQLVAGAHGTPAANPPAVVIFEQMVGPMALPGQEQPTTARYRARTRRRTTLR